MQAHSPFAPASLALGLLAALLYSVGVANAAPLHEAAKAGQTAEILSLLDAGANINEPDELGVSALHWSVSSGRPAAVRALLERGADVEAETGFGSTPLHWAAARGNRALIRLLVSGGSDVNRQNYVGATPAAVARRDGNSAARTELSARGGREPGNSCQSRRFTSPNGFQGYQVLCR
jgi:ankyrin repeat protein